MQNSLRTPRSRARQLANRPGFTALAILMLSLGVGATTALFGLVDSVMPPLGPNVRCETAMRVSMDARIFAPVRMEEEAELRDRVSDAYEASVESASDAVDALPDAISDALPGSAGPLGERPLIAILGALAIGFLLACTRGAAGMIGSRRPLLVAIGTTIGALLVAMLSMRVMNLPAIGMRAVAFALSLSLVTVLFARIAQKRGAPLTI